MQTVRDNLEDTLGVLKSPAPVMGGRVCFRSYFFFFLPLQKTWLSSSKNNNHILNLIGMLAVSRGEKEKEGEICIYSTVEISLFREFLVHSSK